MKQLFKSAWVWIALAAAVLVGWFKRPTKREDLKYYEEILQQKQAGEKQAIRDEADRRRRLAGTVNPSSELPELLRRIRARRRADDGDST